MNPGLASGIDLVEISRFRELSPAIRDRFFLRVFTQQERGNIGASFERAAGIFAAKEALAKALGCGIGPIRWQEIEVLRDEAGKPELNLSGNALSMAEKKGVREWSVSISHTKNHAVAMVICIIAN